MLSLSQTTGYAILALSCLDAQGRELVLERKIAQETGISKPYLSKILHRLAQAGLIISKRGYKGGIALARPTDQVSILDVSEAVDGADWREKCLLGMPQCSGSNPCPLHSFWGRMRPKIEEKLKTFTLADVMKFKQTGWRLSKPTNQEVVLKQ